MVWSEKIWPINQPNILHWLLQSCNSQYVYVKVHVIQTALTYSSNMLQPIPVNETHVIAKLTVPYSTILIPLAL
jgi:hypothetical protein